MARRSLLPQLRARGVTAVLGPTNTGKTHLAIERMLGHESGMIGLPLRLLAREVYQRVVDRVGAHNVALVTGEEKIKPDKPRYWVSTIEAMPRDLDLSFVAVDEVQLGERSRPGPRFHRPPAEPAWARRDASDRLEHHAAAHRGAGAGRPCGHEAPALAS